MQSIDDRHVSAFTIRRRATSTTALSLLAALSRSKHIEILAVLSLGRLTVTDLAFLLGYDKPDVSRILRVLRNCGLVVEVRDKKRHYQALTGKVKAAIDENRFVLSVDPGRGEKVAVAIEIDRQTLRLLTELRRDTPAGRGHRRRTPAPNGADVV